MYSDYGTIMSLVTVGFIWGVTNPFIKRGTTGVDKISESNIFRKVIKEIVYLISNWKYTAPFIVNQCGSVLYFFALKHAELTVAVPVTNSLSFVFTALTGWLLGEETPDPGIYLILGTFLFDLMCGVNLICIHALVVTLLGMVLVAVGISCYVLA